MKTTIIILLAILLAFPVFSEEIAMPKVYVPTAASNGFGGHHIAFTDNVFSLFVNPAAMIRVQERSFFTLAASVFSPESTFNILSNLGDLAGGDLGGLGSILDTLKEQKGKLALGVDLPELPLSIAWVANGFGFGLWNRTFINANIRQENVEAHIYGDVMLPVGIAFRIFEVDGHTIDSGLSYKPFVRIRAEAASSMISALNSADALLDDISIPVIAGASANLGFLYRWDMGLQAGLTIDDMFSFGKVVADLNDENNNNSYYVPYTINLGVAYDFKIGRFWKDAPSFIANTGITFAADWRNFTNVFNQDEYLEHHNFLLDFGLGVQITLLDLVHVRVGMNEMLPAFGLGVELGAIKIDMAYYGKELGWEPGQLSTAVLDFSFSFRPSAKKRDWSWTKRTIVGALMGTEK
jgi:hypothetical protein